MSCNNAAEHLQGLTLDERWTVVERVERGPGASGGNFSVGYIVEQPDGLRAFLKALDYRRALESENPPAVLEAVTASYNYERRVLQKAEGLSRIVSAIEDGKVNVPGSFPIPVVNYLILELASSDVRQALETSRWLDSAVILRSLHHVATGLDQLHKKGLAHQDIKPSNVLVFSDDSSKIGDLGRAAYEGHVPPYDPSGTLPFAGDPAYAAPEALYGMRHPDWAMRSFSQDAYLLGSLTMFMFSNTSATPALVAQLDPDHRPRNWGGTYQDVLPYVRAAFADVMEEFEQAIPEPIQSGVGAIVRQLCEPDAAFRGHPITRARLGNQYRLERYVSQFDLLSRNCEVRFVATLSR